MSTGNPFEIGSRFVDDLVDLLPVAATRLGISGRHGEWNDLTPDGHGAVADLCVRYRAELAAYLDHEDSWQRLAARVATQWLSERLAEYEEGDYLRDLGHMASPLQEFREIFDLMGKETAGEWAAICSRLERLDEGLAGYRETLETGRRRGLVAAARQVRSAVRQAESLAGEGSAFGGLLIEATRAGSIVPRERLEEAASRARLAAAGFAGYLEQTYLPSAAVEDGVGEERYLRSVERFLGMRPDLRETYAWGWEEIARLQGEMETVGARLLPDRTIREVADWLEHDPDHAAHGRDAFVTFVAEREEQALSDLAGRHFDVPSQIRRITVNLAPPGGALGAFYLQPSEDFSRPGGIWYSVEEDRELFPLYQEVSTAYHEGFPGHHLQVGTSLSLGDRLSRIQRLLIWYSGYGEGWALYTERLMDELGYFERPDYLFGMLASQLFRACRVVVDIGCHLGLAIPEGAPLPAGAWTFERAVELMEEVGLQPHEYAVSEVTRYLGWPGQAIAYKVGERVILGLRDELRRTQGASFDLKEFHRRVLGHGEMGLDRLREVVLTD